MHNFKNVSPSNSNPSDSAYSPRKQQNKQQNSDSCQSESGSIIKLKNLKKNSDNQTDIIPESSTNFNESAPAVPA